MEFRFPRLCMVVKTGRQRIPQRGRDTSPPSAGARAATSQRKHLNKHWPFGRSARRYRGRHRTPRGMSDGGGALIGPRIRYSLKGCDCFMSRDRAVPPTSSASYSTRIDVTEKKRYPRIGHILQRSREGWEIESSDYDGQIHVAEVSGRRHDLGPGLNTLRPQWPISWRHGHGYRYRWDVCSEGCPINVSRDTERGPYRGSRSESKILLHRMSTQKRPRAPPPGDLGYYKFYYPTRAIRVSTREGRGAAARGAGAALDTGDAGGGHDSRRD
ncbi:hypothetical protein EVAR_33313_1 [Eumeta japonica]|uniref:Uncharacterized protein n=1 Tax=Eumeta variegata TaxID=151549 RepID=A0A4C1WH44_EUMVA|nr:hypothetical protein EVAR_33313_1 [Eumeta japonica]